MVGDDDLGRHQPFAPFEVAALAEQRAMSAGAGAGLGRHGAPDPAGWVSRLSRSLSQPPLGQGVGQTGVEAQACLGVVARVPCLRGLVGEQVVVGRSSSPPPLPPPARRSSFSLDTASAPLWRAQRQRAVPCAPQAAADPVHQLLLQRHRGRGDQYLRAARQRHGNRRYAVGQRLAHAGAGLMTAMARSGSSTSSSACPAAPGRRSRPPVGPSGAGPRTRKPALA